MIPKFIRTPTAGLRRLLWPPQFEPHYEGLRYASEDQHELKQAWFRPNLTTETVLKGHDAIAEKYTELSQEITRRVERDLSLVENSQKLFANTVQFGLVAAGIVASLGAWLNLYLVWLPLTAFILSISAAWWFLCKEPPDFSKVSEIWFQRMPTEFDGLKRPDNFRKEMYTYFYESNYFVAVREYRKWLHQRLAVPAALFVLGLILLLVCVSISPSVGQLPSPSNGTPVKVSGGVN